MCKKERQKHVKSSGIMSVTHTYEALSLCVYAYMCVRRREGGRERDGGREGEKGKKREEKEGVEERGRGRERGRCGKTRRHRISVLDAPCMCVHKHSYTPQTMIIVVNDNS